MNTLLSPFLGWLLRSSWQASVLTLVVLAAQWIFQKQLSARWRHALWFSVVARLALPASLPSPISLFNYTRIEKVAALAAPAPAPIAPLPVSHAAPSAVDARFSETLPSVHIAAKEPAVIAHGTSPAPAKAHWFRRENAPEFLQVLWLTGLVFFAVRVFGQNILFFRGLGQPGPVKEPRVLALFKDCQTQMGVRSKIKMAETNVVKSPALYGLLQRTLLLPAGMLGQFREEELRHIFLHELAHVKRRDMAALWLVTFCQIMHWFNPVLWFGFRRMAEDRELACDELALSRAGESENRRYGETILKLLEICARPASVPGLMGILEDKNQMRRRIAMIAQFKRQRWSIAAGSIVLAVGLVTLTDAQNDKPADVPKPSSPATDEMAKATRDYQTALATYQKDQDQVAKDRQAAAAAIFRLGEACRLSGKTEEANAHYRRILSEFADQTEFTGLSQKYVLGLKQSPPGFVRSIDDVLYPGGVAVDSAGNIYISDTHRNRIRKFDKVGTALTAWGGRENEEGSLNYPQGLAVDGKDKVYVADVENNRVQKFSSDGKFLTAWGKPGSGPGEFNRPYNIAVDRAGNIYVVDSENGRVQKFTSDGTFISIFGSLGNGEGQLRQPQGVAVDGNGTVYVGDGCNGQIQKFSADGKPLRGFQSGFIHDVAVDAQGNVYVANTEHEAVQMYLGDGTLMTQWGSKGSGPGQFDFLARVTVDSARSRVLITDAKNNRVQIFAYPQQAVSGK